MPKLIYALYSAVVEVAEQEGLPPQVLEEEVLLKIAIICDEDVEVLHLVILQNGFCFYSVRVSQIIDVHVVLLALPHPHLVRLLLRRRRSRLTIRRLIGRAHRPDLALAEIWRLVVLVVEIDEFKWRWWIWLLPLRFWQQALAQNGRADFEFVVKNGGAVHQHIPVYPIIRHHADYFVLSQQRLPRSQMRRQVVLFYLDWEGFYAVFDVLQEAAAEVQKLLRQSINELLARELVVVGVLGLEVLEVLRQYVLRQILRYFLNVGFLYLKRHSNSARNFADHEFDFGAAHYEIGVEAKQRK